GAGPRAVSAASADRGLAPNGIGTLYGSGFAPDGLRIAVVDTAGIERAGTVFYAGASQVNFLVPDGTAVGPARVRVLRGDGSEAQSTAVQVNAVAPAVFTATASGRGVPAAIAVQGGAAVEVFRCSGPLLCVARPLEPRDGRPVYLSLFVTGLRWYRSGVRVTFAGEDVPVEFAGAQSQFAGLDQVNVRLERTLRARGEEDLVVIADGVASNVVRVLVQ
ncbi:MAG: hypothetical protein SGI92_06495, partial [Bryobacteraceae bacterium]|nr:hypothetical protein [Bryobacteraceae bacterium]